VSHVAGAEGAPIASDGRTVVEIRGVSKTFGTGAAAVTALR